jgi:NAD(P)-dependent dehydrogenase (short-subunit alcohol dehydrogenase family)
MHAGGRNALVTGVSRRAALLLVREFAARHDDSRPGGRVVLMTSGQHLAPMTSEVAYAVSKGALQQATLTVAEELADRGITVNTVNQLRRRLPPLELTVH